MKLSLLTLNHFRCFQRAEFDLSGDVTAIYGRNGVGKTALFDALEFALLGTIGRYLRARTPPDYLPCRFSQGEMQVRLDFCNEESGWIQITKARHRGSNPDVAGSGSWRNHAGFVFDFLLDPDLSPARRQLEPACDYIRSTLLLSQHSIRTFVEALAPERATILAYLAGVGAIQRRLEKAGAVMEEARRKYRMEEQRLQEQNEIAGELDGAMAEQQGKLNAIRQQLTQDAVTAEALAQALEMANITVDPQSLNQGDGNAVSALVRGLCSERNANAEARLRSLAEVETISGTHQNKLQQNQDLLQRIATSTPKYESLLAEENAEAAKFHGFEREIGELEPKIASQRGTIESLGELQRVQAKQADVATNLAKIESEQRALHEGLIVFRGMIERLDLELPSIPSEEAAYRQRAHQILPQLLAINIIAEAIPDYQSLATTALTQTIRLHQLTSSANSSSQKQISLEAQLQTIERESTEMNRTFLEAKSAIEDSKSLASRLRTHADDKYCPLCGHEHVSLSDLQRAIEENLARVPDNLKRAAAGLEASLKSKADVGALLVASKQELEELQSSLRAARRERDSAIRAIGASLEVKNSQIAEARRELQAGLGRINALCAAGPQQIASGDLAISLENSQSQLVTFEHTRTELVSQREGARARWASLHTQREALEQSRGQWQVLASQLAAEIQDYRNKCSQLGLAEDSSPDVLVPARQHATRELATLQSVQKIADNFALSCRLRSLEGEHNLTRSKSEIAKKSLAEMSKSLSQLQKATREINAWITALSEQINGAITDRIDAHQSEINNLFRSMIPSPHLFDEITMSQAAEGLQLGLLYRGCQEDVGEPHFFLSNAQANVLALSLFLSFNRAQRWAKLETILLDDPVQHLDDLDAVAFLDTLRSVALGGLGPRKQVLLSTCNQNLYLLMIRKFGVLESEGLRFTAISLLEKGEAGPEVHYDIGGPSGRKFLHEAV